MRGEEIRTAVCMYNHSSHKNIYDLSVDSSTRRSGRQYKQASSNSYRVSVLFFLMVTSVYDMGSMFATEALSIHEFLHCA